MDDLELPNMGKNRNQIIDCFRGILIFDMILVHFSGYFPVFLQKCLSYTDIAMEGFVLLAGFMIGQHYYGRYIEDRNKVTQRLLVRALQILLIQYALIFTINLPLYFVIYEKIRRTELVSTFLLKSMLFLNQIGLIHIPPTFIPLLLISPVILYLFSKKLDFVAICGSILIFVIGNKYPYALDLGDKTIFPFILWQIYFMGGCFLGKAAYQKGKISPKKINNYFFVSLLIFLVAMFIKHGKVIAPSLTSKFPLNALGLLYGASLLFVIYTFTLKYWHVLLGKIRAFNYYLPFFGRHSLLIFVVHVYIAKTIGVINYSFDLNPLLNYFLILLSFVGIWKIICLYEGREKALPVYNVVQTF